MRPARQLIVLVAFLSLGACKSWLFDKQPEVNNSSVTIADDTAMNAVVANVADGAASADQKCASQVTYDAIKKSIFDAAKKRVTTNASPLNSLSAASILRMNAPLLRNANAQLNRTECSGQLTVVLPPAARNAFGGVTDLSADVQYAVQPAADGSGVVVEVTGTSAMSDQLAAATDAVNQRKAAGGVGGFGSSSTGTVTAFAGKTYNPAFDCGGRLTNAMRMICQDETLSKADRDMDAAYKQAKVDAAKEKLPALIKAQRAFLKARDACADSKCMSDLYSSRAAEIEGDGE